MSGLLRTRTLVEWSVALLLCLAAVEGTLRLQQWLGPVYDLSLKGETLDWYSDVVNHKPIPHQVQVFEGASIYGDHAGFSYTLEYDDNGIRQPVSAASPPGCTTKMSILYLGDSFMQGYDIAHSIPERVTREFAAKRGLCLTGYNAGFASYSPAILVPLARRLMPVARPDYVVIDIDETDLGDDVFRYDKLIERNAAGENVGVRASPTNVDISRRLSDAKKSPFYTDRLIEKLYVRQVLMPRIAEAQPDMFMFARDKGSDLETKYAAELKIFRRNIAELIAVLSPARVVFIHHPHLQQLTGEWNDLLPSTVEKVAKEHGALFFDATPVLRQSFGARPQSYYWTGDIHFTFEGLDLYADSVTDYLETVLP